MNSIRKSQLADRLDPGHGTSSDGSISCRNSAGNNLWCSINDASRANSMPWVMDYAHFALFSYVPYLIPATGTSENQEFAAAFVRSAVVTGDSGTTPSVSWNTTPSQCYIGHRALTANAADGTPDTDYGIAATAT